MDCAHVSRFLFFVYFFLCFIFFPTVNSLVYICICIYVKLLLRGMMRYDKRKLDTSLLLWMIYVFFIPERFRLFFFSLSLTNILSIFRTTVIWFSLEITLVLYSFAFTFKCLPIYGKVSFLFFFNIFMF